SILHNPGFNISSVTTQPTRQGNGTDAAFYRRAGNSIQYWTPNINGFVARIAYQLTEGRTIRAAATSAAVSIKPSIISASAGYDTGPIKLRASFEGHLDYFGLTGMSATSSQPGVTNPSSFDYGAELLAQYTNPAPDMDTRIVGVLELLSYSN